MGKSKYPRHFPLRSWWKDLSTGKIYYIVGIGFDKEGQSDFRELQEVGTMYDPFNPMMRHMKDLCELWESGHMVEYLINPT